MITDVKFPLISENISIELINTEILRHGTKIDLLARSEYLIEWLNSLITKSSVVMEQLHVPFENWVSTALPPLLDLRQLIRENYEEIADGKDISPYFVEYLQTLITKAPFMIQVKNESLIPIPIGTPNDALISLIALDALKLIASKEINNIKRCTNPKCVLLFLDTKGRRKWCSMKICGNREKVTRHQKQNKTK